MVRRPLLPLLVVVALACVACSGDDDDSAEAPAGTVGTAARETTTTTDPELTVEEEVEAAYLRSWDVYAEAVLTFDTSELNEVYVGDALDSKIDEVNGLREANTPARMDVIHDITIAMSDPETAVLHDDYFNHSVLLDGDSGEPIEDDPNEIVKREYLMRLVDGAWKVAFVTAR